jgi:cytohesin
MKALAHIRIRAIILVLALVLVFRLSARETGGSLREAVVAGNLKQVQAFIDGKADLSAKGKDGKTALILAAENGRADVLAALLAAGADPEATDFDLWKPLTWAAAKGRLECVKILLEKGTKAAGSGGGWADSALIRAAANGHTEVVRAMLDKGADPNSRDMTSRALIRAVDGNHGETVKALLDAKADLNIYDANGQTALMHAAANGNAETVKLLLERGADPNYQPSETNKLLTSYIDPSSTDTLAWRQGLTPLLFAAASGDPKTVTLLLDHRAELNARDRHKRNALWLPAANGSTAVAEVLIQKGIDLNAQDEDGWTPLMVAARNGQTEIVKLLLTKKADVALKDAQGETALKKALKKQRDEIAVLLKKAGATE